jgi:Protein of unknown function (DUF2752)
VNTAARGRGRLLQRARLVPPLAVGAVVAAATAAVAIRDPHVPGSWGVCPWLVLTGTYCPGCGGLRAVHDLTHLHIVDALSSNAVVVMGCVLAVAGWAVWLGAAWRGRTGDWSRWVKPWMAYACVTALLLFSVLRNLPVGAWFAPDLLSAS